VTLSTRKKKKVEILSGLFQKIPWGIDQLKKRLKKIDTNSVTTIQCSMYSCWSYKVESIKHKREMKSQ
jgi:hypothetical protein